MDGKKKKKKMSLAEILGFYSDTDLNIKINIQNTFLPKSVSI